jgi:hypothetical protein
MRQLEESWLGRERLEEDSTCLRQKLRHAYRVAEDGDLKDGSEMC